MGNQEDGELSSTEKEEGESNGTLARTKLNVQVFILLEPEEQG